MAKLDLKIVNGTVATAADVFRCDIGVRGGRIALLGDDLPAAEETIDAAGRLIVPGGIDSHCHMDQQPWEGRETADDFRSGTISAACGGNTTVIPFAMQVRGQRLRPIVDDYHERAGPKAVIDYAFHLILGDPTPQVMGQELPGLVRDGCTSIKIFLTYDLLVLSDYQVLDVLSFARREGAMIMIHAENDDCVRWLTDKLLAAGKTGIKFHGKAHSAIGDREATQRAISLAEIVEVPILIAHVSAREAAAQIRSAQDRGLRIFAETCPQYLFLTEDDMDTHDMEGAKYVCTPPPRTKDDQEYLWRGLQNGTFQVFSSDHSPWRYSDKISGGPRTPFHKIPNGVPGIETRLPLLFSEGVGKGRITLNQFVALGATNAAKIYGLYPRKGTIAIGSDADLAIWDTEREVTIRNDMLHHNADYTAYEGMQVRGWPVITISRGEVVWRDGEVLGQPGRGRFLPCDLPNPPSDLALPS
ncbi:MAG: dihydropyrimidinase [Rhodospirillaceae bacterium]|jgi:dihydropyrimidinase|nr:dihydropyrimidinase [Rhodospirillaceae bacterium]